VLGTVAGASIALLPGVARHCDGVPMDRLAFPVRLLRLLGADSLIVCDVGQALHPDWRAGEVVAVTDHINLMGGNPLTGPNLDAFGPRFPDMTAAYDPDLR